ncbi:hypothetical protein ElyMa_003082200 [Elysia marginata]|uniref:PPM-type phosphatase domain-containing protein n=1 Tax=Elysia marginata TaxID=1093978 RepID=A0AAV4IPY9_9GAST|nr:hypothetical protein ElyMa_003082200 [Elysia marginata]
MESRTRLLQDSPSVLSNTQLSSLFPHRSGAIPPPEHGIKPRMCSKIALLALNLSSPLSEGENNGFRITKRNSFLWAANTGKHRKTPENASAGSGKEIEMALLMEIPVALNDSARFIACCDGR